LPGQGRVSLHQPCGMARCRDLVVCVALSSTCGVEIGDSARRTSLFAPRLRRFECRNEICLLMQYRNVCMNCESSSKMFSSTGKDIFSTRDQRNKRVKIWERVVRRGNIPNLIHRTKYLVSYSSDTLICQGKTEDDSVLFQSHASPGPGAVSGVVCKSSYLLAKTPLLVEGVPQGRDKLSTGMAFLYRANRTLSSMRVFKSLNDSS
jgi:hypothetical protein